jgi:prepilin-type N-terminal cleavage/methylation domain-containing protein
MIERLRKMKGQKGFTLLELLVVVAIIAILATLILANLNRARKQAQDAKVQSEVKSISDAVQLYQTSNSGNATNSLLLCHAVLQGGPNNSTNGGCLSNLNVAPDPILATIPTHPSDHYYFLGDPDSTGTSFTYTVEGNLISKTGCYSITDGVATTKTTACPH